MQAAPLASQTRRRKHEVPQDPRPGCSGGYGSNGVPRSRLGFGNRALQNNTRVSVCPVEWDYPAGTVIDVSLEESETFWRTNEKDEEVELLDTCQAQTIKGSTTNTGSSTTTVSWPIEELTWGGCTKETITSVSGKLEIHAIQDTHNGTLTGKGSSWLVNTVVGKCTYGTAETGTHLGTVTGGTMATIDIADTIPLVKDDTAFQVCPKVTFWTARFTVTSPEPLYIATS